MDNIKLLWDSNILLQQSLGSSDGYSTVLFARSSLSDAWWNVGVTSKKDSDDQVSKSSQSQISYYCTNELRTFN